MWILLNSTWKGQLKNVQDGKSRPQGSREIQKTKVETVLRDTLYEQKNRSLRKLSSTLAYCSFKKMTFTFGSIVRMENCLIADGYL